MELTQPPSENWGQTLRRLRGNRDAKAVMAVIAEWVPYGNSHMTLRRLEKMSEPPAADTAEGKRWRVVAALALLVYGYDPAALGLSITDDLPRGVNAEDFMAYTQDVSPSPCMTMPPFSRGRVLVGAA